MTPELKENLQIIAGRFPDLFQELRSNASNIATAQEIEQYCERIYGSRNERALFFQRWAGVIPSNFRTLFVTGGFGDGSHIQYLLNSCDESCKIAVVEADLPKFLAVLNSRDLSSLLTNPRILLMAPFSSRESIARLNIELIEVDSTSIFLYAPIYEQSDGLYKNLLDTIIQHLTTRWNQIQTDIDHGQAVYSNTLENIFSFGYGIEANGLNGIFQGKPLILVAAGPSLDDAFDFLKLAQGKAVIVVANSAYRAVVNQGIKVDITVAVDPNPGTMRGYEGVDTSHPFLLTSFLVYPDVPKCFADRVIPLAEYNFTASTLRKLLKLSEQTQWIGDGTVTSTIINAAAHFGCNQVFLVGQDLAVAEDGRSHTQDSFYTDDNANNVALEDCRKVRGNFKDLVHVEEKLFAYLKIIEAQVSNYHQIEFLNISQTGAYIHGAKPLTKEAAMLMIEDFPEIEIREQLEKVANTHRIPPNYLEATQHLLAQYFSFLEQLLSALMRYAVSVELLDEAEKRVVIEHMPESDTIRQAYHKVVQILEKHPLFTIFIMEGKTKKEYHESIRSGEPWRLINHSSSTLGETLNHTWALVEGIVYQIDQLSNYLDTTDRL